MSQPPSPRFVPTLNEVVQPSSLRRPRAEADVIRKPPMEEEELIHRVLQRVDLGLDRRLREAVGQLILEHTQSLAPQLREELEKVVRDAVSQAFEQELTKPAGLP